MASSAEQPLKKRKLYEPPPESSAASAPQPSFAPAPAPAPPPPPPSQEEILRKRRNREEIRSLYDCYRRIKYCVAQKDPRLMPDFEQAYLALITASRGCTSVQRIVADLIPRYASYCPTALEAAAKVSINMYNWSLAIIMRGEDADGIAYQTAKACIFGLVDICCTASYEAPTSSVIQGICSAVFQNVLTFFISTFEGRDIYQIGIREIVKLQESVEFFRDLKQELADDDESIVYKLFKFRALSLLRIFFSFPKNLLAACFELLLPSGADALMHTGGQYFLSQVTCHLNVDEVSRAFNKSIDGDSLCTDSNDTSTKCKQTNNMKSSSNENSSKESSLLAKYCFLGMVIEKDLSMKDWIVTKCKRLCKSLDSKDASDIESFLEKSFGSLLLAEVEADCEESDEDNFDPAKYANNQGLVHKISIQHNEAVNVTAQDHTSGISDTSSNAQNENRNGAVNVVEENVKPCRKVLPHEANIQSANESSYHHGKVPPQVKKLVTRDHEDSCSDKTSFTKAVIDNQLFSCTSVKQSNLRSDSKGENLGVKVENYALNTDLVLPANKSAPGHAPNFLPSPRQNFTAHYQVSSNQILWYFDGDSAAMDVFPASKQLWLGSLGRGASETLARLQFEDFGPLERFMFFPSKDFALIEFRNIMDAVRARERMQGSCLWGGCIDIKFLDAGLGCKGAVNGAAVGESCHVYIGKVKTKWAKDEILNELMTQGLRSPHVITDLPSESALLLEFGTAEEATVAMTYIRKQRKETGSNESSTISACSKNKFRNSEMALYHDEEKHMPNKSNSLGYVSSFTNKAENNIRDLESPRIKTELSTRVQNEHAFQSNWRVTSYMDMRETGSRRVDDFESMTASGPSFTGLSASVSGDQIWQYKKHDMEPNLLSRGCVPRPPVATHGASMIPPPIQTSFVRPHHFTPNGPWDGCSLNPPLPLHHTASTGVMHIDNHRVSPCPTLPFIPSSVTPLSQLHGSSVQRFDQVVTPSGVPGAPAISPPLRPPSDAPPPLPSSPPPLPLSQPPCIPPPPNSPPPLLQPSLETSTSQGETCSHYQWQGTLSKSGVHYCTIYATREDSSACKYSNAVSEPADWPTRLDVTKRTDFRHVKTTFTSTPSHKREVCRLLPSTTSDHKGFHDFISYLRQRECAGVIKIPAGKSMWARLLFILPYSVDTCSLLAISPHPAECLIVLVLPKETNSE